MLNVDTDKSHVYIIIFHVDIIHLACIYATILTRQSPRNKRMYFLPSLLLWISGGGVWGIRIKIDHRYSLLVVKGD